MGLKAYSGVGCVYMAHVDADGLKTTPFRRVGNAYPLSVQVETEKQEQKSRMCDTAGQVLATKVEITGVNGKLVLKEWNAENLAMALAGTAVSLSGSGGSIADEAITAPEAGEYVELAHDRIENVVVTDSGGGTTYAAGTDYIVNTKLGMMTIVAGGAISAGASLLVDYDYAAESGYRVDVGTMAQVRVAIKANLRDEYDPSREFNIEIDKAVLASDGEINFISDKGSEGEDLSFSMTMETMTGKTCPMRIDGIDI